MAIIPEEAKTDLEMARTLLVGKLVRRSWNNISANGAIGIVTNVVYHWEYMQLAGPSFESYSTKLVLLIRQGDGGGTDAAYWLNEGTVEVWDGQG